MTFDRIDELIALAALGELSADEELELDELARRDPAVAAELDEALTTAAALQRPHVEKPPAALRDSVMAAIGSTPQDVVGPAGTSAREDAETRPVVAPVTPIEQTAARRRFHPMILAAAAVAVFVVGGLVAVVATDDATSDPIAAVVDAPDAVRRSLTGEIGDLTVIYSEAENALVVEGRSLPVLGESSTYQLWLVGDDAATSVGVFRPDADGSVSERFSDADPSGLVLGVTEEPAGGSESPTLPILASA